MSAADQQRRLPPEADAPLQRLQPELAHSQAAYQTVLRALHRKVSPRARPRLPCLLVFYASPLSWATATAFVGLLEPETEPKACPCRQVPGMLMLRWPFVHPDAGVRLADGRGAGPDRRARQGCRQPLGAAAAVRFLLFRLETHQSALP